MSRRVSRLVQLATLRLVEPVETPGSRPPYPTTNACNSPTGNDRDPVWLAGIDPDIPSALQLICQFVVAVTV